MANVNHLQLIEKGVESWNTWREQFPDERPDLELADLSGRDLRRANLSNANLVRADLTRANLRGANLNNAKLHHARLAGAWLDEKGTCLVNANLWLARLEEAQLTSADLSGADLTGAVLCHAKLDHAILCRADARQADFSLAYMADARLEHSNLLECNFMDACLVKANLQAVNLRMANLVKTDLRGANLTGAYVYGVSAWKTKTNEATIQLDLVITPEDESAVMVDDLEVAQFIYLLLHREKIRNVIDTVTRRGVLLLGRFGDGGLALLQALAAWLRRPENGGYIPLLFDFPRPESKTYTETIRTLVGLVRFVVVDLSGPSVPQEIAATVDLYEIPFVPILEQKRKDWSMFRDFLIKERVLEPIRFTDQVHLLELLAEEVIAPAEKLIEKRQQRLDKIFGRA